MAYIKKLVVGLLACIVCVSCQSGKIENVEKVTGYVSVKKGNALWVF